MRKRAGHPHYKSSLGAKVAVGLTAVIGLATACKQEALVPVQALGQIGTHAVTVNAEFCTSQPTTVQQKIKYVFVIDNSGSNQPGFPLVPGDAWNTDPSGSRRYGPLAQFVRTLSPDPNNLTYFNAINFNSGVGFIDQPYFDSDSAQFLGALNRDWIGIGTGNAPAPIDSGFTNYSSALSLVANLITADAQAEAGNLIKPIVQSRYQIIFVSDGIPTIPNGGGTCVQAFNPAVPSGSGTPVCPSFNLQAQIDQILSIPKNNPSLSPFISGITLNTAYYYQSQELSEAETLLKQMAQEGNGQYLQFGPGEGITYQAFAAPYLRLRYKFQDLFVENENAVWWDDGSLQLDSDGDGIPDAVEVKLGSNPLARDSDGNGVSDLVEYRTKGAPCSGAACAVALRDSYSVCAGLSPTVSPDGTVKYPDTDQDGLNDCEEYVLKSDRSSWDSNGDFIPDFLEFKVGMPIITGTNESQAQPLGDGMTNYDKLKAGLPLGVAANKILNLSRRVTAISRLPSSSDLDCYSASVSNVAAIGQKNTFRLYMIQNTTVIGDSPIVKIVEKTIDSNTNILNFNQTDFP